MRILRLGLAMAALLCAVDARAQTSEMRSAEAPAFIGTWVVQMSNPQGAVETVRIWDEGGGLKASVQSGRGPGIRATGIMKDDAMLVLTATRFENGKADRAVIALTLVDGTLNMSQMLEFSQTIKRGSGKRADAAP